MANNDNLAKLKEGVRVWNAWRRANPQIRGISNVGNLSEANELNFRWADLRAICLADVNLGGADLYGADLRGMDLSEADLSNTDLRTADLTGANLCQAKLCWAELQKANLCEANLADTNLAHAQLSEAILDDACLSKAHCSGADFSRAKLRRADLSKGNLGETRMDGADLSGANLTDATLFNTIFEDNDLRSVTGLETVRHLGPSIVSIGTIYRSQGRIPVEFLRGAGVPENFIEYMPSLATPGAVQFYSCFISYSTRDQEFADRLYADLQNKGVRCWFAPHDIQAGKKLHEQIDDAIRMHEKLLLILSSNSMSSEWVKTEIRKARKRERVEKKRVLFPVHLVSFDAIQDWELFDADEGKDLAVEIREYHIPDFSDWKHHDLYAEGLKSLLRDLKAEQPKTA